MERVGMETFVIYVNICNHGFSAMGVRLAD